MGKTGPAHEIKLGTIRATIWENETENHDSWFNVTISRHYKADNAWKEAATFGRDDLPIAVKALDMAYSWIWRKQLQTQRREKNGANEVFAQARR